MKAEDYFKPVTNHILVKLAPVSETSKGGILLPNQKKTRSQKMLVLAVGSLVEHCKVGDYILVENGEFKPLKHEDFNSEEEYAITKETCVIGVFE